MLYDKHHTVLLVKLTVAL